MKTTAFLIRVAICLILSLVPVTELENQIYTSRMELRGKWGAPPNIVIIDLPYRSREVYAELQALRPAAVWVHADGRSAPWAVTSDGTIRRARLEADQRPSPALRIYDMLHLDPKPLARVRDPHLINYRGPAGSFPRCSVSQVRDGACGDLGGKILLLNEDTDSTPLVRTPLGEMALIEVLANDVNTVVNRHPIYQASFPERMLLALAMILLTAFYIIYYPVLISAIAVTGTGITVVIVLFQIVFQAFEIYIPSANIALAMLITYLVFTGYRLAFQENLQWRSLKQAQYLRELDQMKTNFLSLVSHDLKTPLAKIQATTERMRRELQHPSGEPVDWDELLDSVENSNDELKHYITSVLNLSRIESQKVILNKRSNDVNRLIEEALNRLSSLAAQKGITIERHLEPLFSIECDEDLLRQVLTNLIDNAIKYSPARSKVIVRSREEESFVRVDVEDFGPGIPKDQLPLMFRKFSRYLRPIQEQVREQVKGTGLGLYLSKYFIELHGGSIRLKSVEGQGTTFTFLLPVSDRT